MKLSSILILIIFNLFFSSKNIFALGSDLEFGLTSRGGLVLSREARSYEEIDIGELISMGSTIPGVFFRQENPELREIGTNFGTLLSQVRSLTSTPEERANAAHQISQLLIQLRSNHPETFNEIQRLERERRGYDFDTEDLPSYCENFPNINSEDLQVFYSQEGVDPNLPTCFRNVGEFAVNNDIERVSEVMRAIQAESLDPQLAEFRARMMSEVANGILNQRGIYGGLSGTPESLYPSCFGDSNTDPLFNTNLFQRNFQRDFNASKERGSADSASRESLLRSSLSSTLYQQVLRLYKNDILPPPVVARQERAFECRTDLALRQGLIFEFASIPNQADMSVYCYSEEYLLLRFENDEQCLEAYNNFFEGSTNEEYEACINSQESGHDHANAHQLVDAVMAEQVKESPLLFSRSRQGLGNSSASPMARKLSSLPGMENLLKEMLPELGSGLANFNERFDTLLSENQAELERIYQAALQDEEVTQSIDQEINDYQEALDNSLNEMCENGGENLHHIPELVSSVRQSMVENASGDLSREEALVRSQNMECYLLREYPPEDDGQLHPALYYLGIAGGTALAFVNPLLGAGVILGVEGVNSYTRITATQAQLEDVLASAHGGFSSQEQLERNRRIRDGAIVDSAVTLAGEVVLGGIVTDAARLVRGGRGLAVDQAPLLSRVELPPPLSNGVRRNARNLFDDSREIRFGDEFNATLRADSPISYNHNGEYINGTIVSINEETGTATVRSNSGPFAGNPGVDVDIALTGINAPVPDLLTSGGPLEIDHLVDVPGLFLNRTVPLRLREIDGETAIVTSSDGGVFRVPLSDLRGASPMDEARFLRESRFEDTTVVRGDVTRLPQYNTLEGITETSTHRAVTQALIDATPERYTEVVNSVFASRRDNTIVLGDFHIGGRHNPADSERNLENSISFLRSNRERFSEGQVIIAGDVTDSSIYNPLLTSCPNNNYSLCSDGVRNQIREQVFARQADILARISRESGLPPERFTFQLGNHELPRQSGDRISGPQTTGRGEILYDQRARADLLSYLRSREDLGGLNILEDVDGSSQRTLPNGLNTEVSHYAIPPSNVNLPGSPALGPRAGSPIDGDVDIIIGADNHTLDIRFDGDATARGYISNPNIGGRGATYDSQVLDEAGNPMERDSGLFTVILGDGRPAVFGPCGSPENTSTCLYDGNEFRAQTFSAP